MQLDEYVHQTLTQICQGIAAAQKDCAPLGAIINPAGITGKNDSQVVTRGTVGKNLPIRVSNVTIEAALNTGTSDSDGGRLGIGVSFAAVKFGGDHADTLSSVNRVTFSVPVVFPVADVPDAD